MDVKLKRATYHLWTFAFSKFISSFGNSIYVFAMSLFILTMTGSAMNFAINMICTILPRTILAPIAGYVADHFPKKVIVLSSQVVSFLIVSGLLVYMVTNGLSVVAIYATTVLLTISQMFTGVAFTSSITRLIDEGRIQKATAINQMVVSFSTIGGPIIGGMLFAFSPIQVFLVIFIIAFFLAVCVEATMDFTLYGSERTKEEKKENMWQGMKAGFLFIHQQPIIRSIVGIALVVNFFTGALLIGVPFILVEILQVDARHFGIIEGILAGGALLGGVYFSIKKDVAFPLLNVKHGLLAFSCLMTLFVLPLIVLIPYNGIVIFYSMVMLLIGFSMTYVNTPIGVLLQKRVSDQYKGRVFGILETGATSLMPLSFILYGFIYDLLGPIGTLLPTGIFLLCVTLYMLRKKIILSAHPELNSPKAKTIENSYT